MLETTPDFIVANICLSLGSLQPSNAMWFRVKADSRLWGFEDREVLVTPRFTFPMNINLPQDGISFNRSLVLDSVVLNLSPSLNLHTQSHLVRSF